MSLKQATPSQLRRDALLAEFNPAPQGAALVVLACAAWGMAVDAQAQSDKWPSLSKCKMDLYAYGEAVAESEAKPQHEMVQEGMSLVLEWAKARAPAVTEEALEDAVHPTEAGKPAHTTSGDGA